ncbi:hypothetical protein IQ06DRAFT_289980 [Phaeosphaeriaceae sp. SRC1lsM3a]|nr:hypothetical protein IQ06DRAFT_289980 [Stagonospora sp. SRC1lsM3a]
MILFSSIALCLHRGSWSPTQISHSLRCSKVQLAFTLATIELQQQNFPPRQQPCKDYYNR